MNASFFSKVYPRFSKMDKNKCPILENGLRELKFSYIITYSASALPISRGLLPIWCGGYDIYFCDYYHNGASLYSYMICDDMIGSIIFYMYYIYLGYK